MYCIDDKEVFKLFDFGSAISKTHGAFGLTFEEDCLNLATCLRFLLSGTDPVASVES